MDPIAVSLVLGVGFLMWGALSYSRLVRLRARAVECWRDIDLQLQRRFDLTRKLIVIVQGQTTGKSDMFEQITVSMARSINESSPRAKAEAEEGLKRAMKPLFDMIQANQLLQVNEDVMQLQQVFEQAEDAIQRSRHKYNAVVQDYNQSIQVFPRSLVAGLLGFHERQLFAVSDQVKRSPFGFR